MCTPWVPGTHGIISVVTPVIKFILKGIGEFHDKFRSFTLQVNLCVFIWNIYVGSMLLLPWIQAKQNSDITITKAQFVYMSAMKPILPGLYH